MKMGFSMFLLSRLSRRFCTQTATSTLITPTATRVHSLFKEKDLTKLVQDFKHLSETPRFRSLHNIYDRTIVRLASAKEFSLIEDILEHQKNYDDIKHEGFAIRIISLYGKAGMPEHAYKLFDEMPERECDRTVKSLNALLHAYVHSNKFDEAVELFHELPLTTSIIPNDRTYTVAIQALCGKREFDSAEKMLDEMESNGVKPNVYTFNILMNGFYSNGRLADGDRVWARMEKTGVEPDSVSFNGKLKGLLHKDDMESVVKLLEDLKFHSQGFNVVTYNLLLSWYCKAGDLDAAKLVYDRLKKSDCIPNRGTYQELIRCGCKKQDFDFVMELCKESVNAKCHIDVAILQNVVNVLVEESRVEDAEKLLQIAYSINYDRTKLKMPGMEE